MQYRNRTLAILKIAGLVGLLSPSLALGAAQVPPSAPVTVVNTTANPVPVTGTIGLTGTANVTVSNTGSNPVPTVSLNQDDKVLNAFRTRLLFGGGSPQTDKEFTVPTGKRLVIQSISVHVDLATGQKPDVFLTLPIDSGINVIELPVSFAGSDALGRDYYKGLHQTNWVADGGTTVKAVGRTFSGANTTSVDINVSGYLVDTQ